MYMVVVVLPDMVGVLELHFVVVVVVMTVNEVAITLIVGVIGVIFKVLVVQKFDGVRHPRVSRRREV